MPYKSSEARRAYVNKRQKEDSEFRRKHVKSSQAWYEANKDRHCAASRKRNRSIKIEALQRYGGKCFCCSEFIVQFLSLDHIEGNGNQHREMTGTVGGVQFYRWLKRHGWPEGFQVSCHNCNLGRHINGGICPHNGVSDGKETS